MMKKASLGAKFTKIKYLKWRFSRKRNILEKKDRLIFNEWDIWDLWDKCDSKISSQLSQQSQMSH